MTKSRRDVLRLGIAGLAAGCQSGRAASGPDAGPPAPAPSGPPTAPVAIQRCASYEPKAIRERLDRALDLIGGIGDLVRGKTVTVKLNLTGAIKTCCDRAAHRTYQTHPHVVAALCAALADGGAARIVLVESFYYREPCEKFLTQGGWDLGAIRSAGAQKVVFENTRNRGRWGGYARLRTAGGGYVYPAFDVNARYEKTDVFVSLPKLKENRSTGVTLAAKNLIGMLPLSLYGNDAPDEEGLKHRGRVVHEGGARLPDGVPQEKPFERPRMQVWQYRVPRVTADVLAARPVDLTVIDGIESVEGGEGPWIGNLKPVEPRLLLAGRNPVCIDAVGAAVMGYDPTADHRQGGFPGENHLRLLAEAGIGSNDPARIEVRGLPVAEAKFSFR